jgi:hypothetical protein
LVGAFLEIEEVFKHIALEYADSPEDNQSLERPSP